MYLNDGTAIPAYLGVTSPGNSMDFGYLENKSLRVGEVIDIIYPEDKARSVSKKFIEYTVSVAHRDGNAPGSTSIYSNCLTMNKFGGMADRFTYTLRKRRKTSKAPDGMGLGSKVLLLCINGTQSDAIILGGVRDDHDITDKQADGHNLSFAFNGYQVTINKDGEMKAVFNGATDEQGNLLSGVDASASGSTVQFKKDGSIVISNATESITINHSNKNIEVAASKNVTIKSAGVLTGAATDNTMMGSTYRQAEQTMHQSMQSALATLTSTLSAAASSLASAGAAASHTLAMPGLAAAGAALSSAASQATALSTAISTFEGSASSYLSKKNLSD